MYPDATFYALLCHMKRNVKTSDKMSRGKMSHFATFYPLSSQRNYTVKNEGVKCHGVKCRGVKSRSSKLVYCTIYYRASSRSLMACNDSLRNAFSIIIDDI